MLKMKYNGNINDLKWIMKSAGKTKILIAGGQKQDEASLLKEIKQLIDAGVYGIAIGRNVWQHNDPLEITKKIKKIVFKS
jgi:class I fructose-bisphosphate aldolase